MIRLRPGAREGATAVRFRLTVVLALLALFALGVTITGASLRTAEDPCQFCGVADLPQGLRITAASAESLGASYAARNLEAIGRAGTVVGVRGAAGSENSRERACLFFQLKAWHGIHLIAELAASSTGVASVCPGDAMAPLRDRYANVAVYPLRFVQQAQLGNGTFCLQYDIPAQYDERLTLGRATLRIATESVKIRGRGKVPVLLREYALGEDEKIGLLFESAVCGRAATMRIEDRGDSLDLVMLHDVRGVYVRKAGLHTLGALVVWRSVMVGDELPENPRVGACAYFPSLTFSLPLMLPDLGLEDLRDFAYPQPLVPKSWFYYPERHLPPWIGATASEGFGRWRTRGPRPRILAELFPDL